MLNIAKAVTALLIVCYPFLVYFGLSHFDARDLALVLIVLAAARLALLGEGKRAAPIPWILLLLSLAAVLLIGLLVMVSGSPELLRLYPVAINAAMLLLFGATLLRPPSMVERIARLKEPDLPPGAVHYSRVVTEVWCGFFLLNGAMALYTALFAELALWTLYNGAIAYLLMALLFAGETLVRRRIRRGNQAAVDVR
jgi:uncharacterized membrane protein